MLVSRRFGLVAGTRLPAVRSVQGLARGHQLLRFCGSAQAAALRLASTTAAKPTFGEDVSPKRGRRQRKSGIVVFASELAALVGKNPFQKPSQVLPAVIGRSFPDLKAVLTDSGLRTTQEVEQDLLSKSPDFQRVADEASKEAAAATDTARLDAVRLSAVSQVESAKEFTTLDPDEQLEVKKLIRSRVAREFGTAQETQAIGRKEADDLWNATQTAVRTSIDQLGIQSKEQAEMLQSAVLQNMTQMSSGGFDGSDLAAGQVAQNADTISRDVVDTVSKVVQQHQADLGIDLGAIENFQKTYLPSVAESVRSAATTGKVRHDTRWRDAVVAHSKFRNLPIIVGGRVDGYNGKDGSLLEVKNRVRRLFNTVVDYEKVQLHAYMRILGLRQCELLERLKRDHSESLSHKVEFDHQFWEEVMARLELVAAGIDVFSSNTEAVAEYAQLTREEDRQIFLKHAVTKYMKSNQARV